MKFITDNIKTIQVIFLMLSLVYVVWELYKNTVEAIEKAKEKDLL